MNVLGLHYLLELKDCNPQILDDLETVQEILLDPARKSQATIIDYSFRKFAPQGISGIIIIAESHFSIHTWPEYGYAAIDIFTCGEVMDPLSAVGYIIEKFQSKNPSFLKMKRGLMSIPFESLSHQLSLDAHPPEDKEICERFFLDFITPSSALVIGGGEGATLRETLKYSSVKRCLMLDIDQQVVEASRIFLPRWNNGAFEDDRTEIIYVDAREYLETHSEKFDVILIDITEPIEHTPAHYLV